MDSQPGSQLSNLWQERGLELVGAAAEFPSLGLSLPSNIPDSRHYAHARVEISPPALLKLFEDKRSVMLRDSLPVKALFFDMDSTVIAEETIVVLADYAGMADRVDQITERAMAGELDFREALCERVALLKGLPERILQDAFHRLTPNPGIKETVARFKARGVPCYLISGGFMELAEPLAQDLGFTGVKANRLGVRLGLLTGEVVGDIIDAAAKRQFLIATCTSLGISPDQVCAVGDGANDLPMMLAARYRVGYRPKSVLWPHLTGAIWHGDHRMLLELK